MKLKIRILTGETFEVEVDEDGAIKDVKVCELKESDNLNPTKFFPMNVKSS